MPSRFVQSIINQVQEAIDRVVGVVNEKNTIIACGDLTKIGSNKNIGVAKDSDASGVADDTFLDDEYTYKIFNFQPNLKYIIFVNIYSSNIFPIYYLKLFFFICLNFGYCNIINNKNRNCND